MVLAVGPFSANSKNQKNEQRIKRFAQPTYYFKILLITFISYPSIIHLNLFAGCENIFKIT